MRDNLFETRPIPPGEFHFGPPVADVFDDMVVRSVPQYEVIQDLLADLALRCCAGRPVYDLGCSTGTTLLCVARRAAAPLTLVGIDRSEAMLLHCREKLAEAAASHDIHLENQDLEIAVDFSHGTPGAIVLCLVLQFLPPERRLALLRQARQHLGPGGCLLVVEKIHLADPTLNALLIEAYYDFKHRNGYSNLEIENKRRALEHRLIPFRPEENLDLLREAGFPAPTIFFAHLNFQGYLALKTP